MIIKNIKLGKIKFNLSLLLLFILSPALGYTSSENINYFGKFIDIKLLDKLSSKSKLLKLEIGKEHKYKNLIIKVLKCKNSEFDDNPEITSYLQVKDFNNKDNNEVFVFNGWTFSSSPSIQVFDHPVYDIWLVSCY